MTERHADRIALLFILPALVFMAGMFLHPLWIVVEQSLTDQAGSLSLAGYRELVSGMLFRKVLITTFEISLSATLITLLIAYPLAYHLAGQPPHRRALLYGLLLLPFWTSILVKSFAFLVIFGDSGIIAGALRAIGIQTVPRMMFNRVGVLIGLVHYFIPVMVFPILSSLKQRNLDLARAAEIMGAGPLRIFWRVTLPLSMPGVLAGVLLTFILCMGFFVTPALMGGRHDVMLANLVDFYTRQTFNWTAAAAASVVLLALSALLILLLARAPGRNSIFGEAT